MQTAEQPSIRPQTRYKPNEMTATLREITSIGLSLWISALACLLGCGQLLASSRLTHDAHSARTALIEMPSCHHSHPSNPSDQKQHDSTTVSCRLPDAIAQKAIAGASLQVTHAPAQALAVDVAEHSRALIEDISPESPHHGRETILQIHLLRI